MPPPLPPPRFDSFSSPQEFAELVQSWPAKRLLAIWSSLPGVQPIRKFQDRKTAATRIWERIQGLATPAPPQPTPSAQPKAERHAKGGTLSAQAAPAKGKAAHKTIAAKKAKRANKSAPAPETTAPSPGSKTAQVVSMLRRKNGATPCPRL
jgi:membrane peptidoglycan carboxypeptidase